jgi:hypothetical protein
MATLVFAFARAFFAFNRRYFAQLFLLRTSNLRRLSLSKSNACHSTQLSRWTTISLCSSVNPNYKLYRPYATGKCMNRVQNVHGLAVLL